MPSGQPEAPSKEAKTILPREKWDFIAHAFVLPSGEVLWQCPVCRGIYPTEIQASNVGTNNGQGMKHKCKARPRRTPVDAIMDPFHLLKP